MNLFKGKKILVVDDDDDLREIIMDEFIVKGAATFGAENGTQALAMLKEQAFDAVVSDVRMPGGDGLFLIQSIREQLSIKPKVFLCSGFNDISKETAAAFDVIEIFTKPFSRKEMIASVAAALGVSEKKAA